MNDHPVIAIVVAHNSAAILPACLAALAREGVSAIVVDNASGDDSSIFAEESCVRVVRNGHNEGYGRAMNIGMRLAGENEGSGSSHCLLLNPDVVVEPGCISALTKAAALYPEAAVLAPRIVESGGRLFFQAQSLLSPLLRNEAGRPCAPEGDCCAPFLSGACLLVDREFILSLGGFDKNLFLFYEDDDLCRRVIDAGRSLVHVHDAVARHVRGGSSEPRRGRVFRTRWHMAWSAGYVAKKYGLSDPSWRTIIVNAAKFLGAALMLDRRLMERYGGSVAGALAWLRGVTALAREGLA